MDFFFVRDYRGRSRFFAAEPLGPLPANFSKTRAILQKAKRKVTGLDQRTLLQEQAFAHGGNPDIGSLRILHAGPDDGRSVRTRFRFFLARKRTRHIVLLAAEGVIVPITGLAAFLPGPNIIFYVLAILMVIQILAGVARHRPDGRERARIRRRPGPHRMGGRGRGP